MHQTREDLFTHLGEQLAFLRSSALAFDQGNRAEAKRLSVPLRTLLHDTHKSHSLLGQLQVKRRLRFPDTRSAMMPGAVLAVDAGLAVIEIGFGLGATTQFVAPLGELLSPLRTNNPAQSFGDWWTSTVIRANDGTAFARRDLVLGLAHFDGGAHVDPDLSAPAKAAYAALTRAASHGWTLFNVDGTAERDELVLANVRQIAFEAELALWGQLPNLLWRQ
jgi:hypothetical protein